MSKAIEEFLTVYDREHATTMRVLRAFPPDKAELRPHPRSKTARELAWIFFLESVMGATVMHDQLAARMAGGGSTPPAPPPRWEDLIAGIEQGYTDFRLLIAAYTDEEFHAPVRFFAGPKRMEPQSRREVAWFLLHDQVHHRGQFSVYLRMADGKVPSIYGPSGDEPWN